MTSDVQNNLKSEGHFMYAALLKAWFYFCLLAQKVCRYKLYLCLCLGITRHCAMNREGETETQPPVVVIWQYIGVGVQIQVPAALCQRKKSTVPIGQGSGWDTGSVWVAWRILPRVKPGFFILQSFVKYSFHHILLPFSAECYV